MRAVHYERQTVAFPLHATVVTDVHEFEQLESDWDALLDESDQPTYFLRWYWNWSWWRHLAPADGQLHILRCTDSNGRVVGIAPFYRRPQRLFGVPYAEELVMLGTGIDLKTSEYLDAFAVRGAERQVSAAMAACLHADHRWDRLMLVRVASGHGVASDLVQALDADTTSVVFDRAPYVDTSVTWADYKHSLGRSMRRNVEYYARRLFARHSCHFTRIESVLALGPAIDHLVRLHQERWQSASEPGTFADDDVVTFLRAVMYRSHAEGRLRLWTLTVDGTVEAALVGFLDNGILHYFQKGFNPAYAREDLGTAMLSLCIRDCFEDHRIRQFDFMGGGAAYKTLWARHERVTMRHEVSRRNVRARFHSALCDATDLGATVYRALVPRKVREVRREMQRRRALQQALRNTASCLWLCLGSATNLAADVVGSVLAAA